MPSRKLVALALVVFATLALGTFSGVTNATTPSTPSCTGADCAVRAANFQSDPAQELADRYAPIVYLKQQPEECASTGEPYAPINVEAMFGAEGNLFQEQTDSGPVTVTDSPTASDLFGKDDTHFLNFPGSPAKPGCQFEQQFREFEPEAENVAYAHIVMEEGQEGLALQYWLYYYFNDWNNNHESDWEMVQLVFDASSVEEALTEDPVRVGFSQHGGGERADWEDDSKFSKEDGHPVVYVAAGSHSNQFEAKNYLGRAEEPGIGFGCDDATAPHNRVPLEARLVNPDPQSADDPYAWLNFQGRWGELSSGEFNGPTGPNTKFSWSNPISWQNDKLREENVAVPSGRTAGLSVVNVFCGVVAWGSNTVLAIWSSWPILTPVVLIGLIAAAVISIVRTDFGYRPPPFRKVRQTGQIIRTSWRFYKRDFLTFVLIGVVMAPFGMLGAALYALVVESPPVENILAVADAPRMIRLLIAVALGTTLLGIAYEVAIVGITAGLVDVEAGRKPSAGAAFRRAWGNAGPLIGARLLATAIVFLLTVSIIGIPWAIHRAVRWTFIEQSILFEGKDRKEAPQRSSELVDGHWGRTFWRVGLLLGIGLFLAPLAAIPLLFFIKIPLGFVNLVSSVGYILLVPLVSTSLALTYFDLRARKEGSAEEDAAEPQA